MTLASDIHTNWDATKRATDDLCRDLWADPGTGDFLERIAEVRAAIHRSAEVNRQPWGAVVTVHTQLDQAASGWSARGSELHRRAEAEVQQAEIERAQREQASIEVAAEAAAKVDRVARGLPEDWRTIEVKPGVRTVLQAPWIEFYRSPLNAMGILVWFDDDEDPVMGGTCTDADGDTVREVLDLRQVINATAAG